MKKRRKNPAFNPLNIKIPAGAKIDVELVDTCASLGTFLVTQSLKGCNFEEMVLISALIPMLVKLLRNAQPTQEEMDKAVEKILNPGNDKTGPNEAEGDGSPTSK